MKFAPDAALKIHDVYERWAEVHLSRERECISRFSTFLTTAFGTPLRLDGLRWIAQMFKAHDPGSYLYRNGVDDTLIELVSTSLNQDAKALTRDSQARQALVEVAAALATKNTPATLALQERIKLLR